MTRNARREHPLPGRRAETEGLDKEGQRLLGRRLKAIYDEIATAPIPQRFLDLLDEIEKKRKNK